MDGDVVWGGDDGVVVVFVVGHQRQGDGVWGCEICPGDGMVAGMAEVVGSLFSGVCDRGVGGHNTDIVPTKRDEVQDSFWAIFGAGDSISIDLG